MIISSCKTIPVHTETSIKELNEKPESYEGQTVQVRGLVTDKVPVFWRRGAIYRIFENEKESIWIFTKNLPAPERGSKLLISGTVKKGTPVANKVIGYIISEEKRTVLSEGTEK